VPIDLETDDDNISYSTICSNDAIVVSYANDVKPDGAGGATI
jgi:hypothetical protein